MVASFCVAKFKGVVIGNHLKKIKSQHEVADRWSRNLTFRKGQVIDFLKNQKTITSADFSKKNTMVAQDLPEKFTKKEVNPFLEQNPKTPIQIRIN